jgi:hypothetical protein
VGKKTAIVCALVLGFIGFAKDGFIFAASYKTADDISSIVEYAILSKNIYGNRSVYTDPKKTSGWKLISNGFDSRDLNSGFHGVAFEKGDSIAIVFEGTNPNTLLSAVTDVLTDIDHFRNKEPSQYRYAEAFVNLVISK